MKKSIFTLFLALVASVGTMFAWDYENVRIGDARYNLDATNYEAELVYIYLTGDVTMDATVEYNSETYTVTSIGNDTFWGKESMTSVTIPETVTSIGEYAFEGCTGLTSVTIPNSVISMGDYIFDNCTNLESVTLGNSVTSIGEYSFASCAKLKSISIGNSVTSIGEYAFYECSELESVTIPNSVISIDQGAFYSCTHLASLTIGNSVTSIGEEAFIWCTDLTSLTIPNSVISIGDNAFYGCSGLASITCKAVTPPTSGSGTFYEVPNTIPVYVPAGSEEDYKAADGWSRFGENIQPIPPQTKEMTPTIGHLSWSETDQQWWFTVYELDASEEPLFAIVLGADGVKETLPTTLSIANSTDENMIFSDAVNPEEFGGIIKDAEITISYDESGFIEDGIGGYYVLAKLSGEMNDADGTKLIVNEPTDFIKLSISGVTIPTAIESVQTSKGGSQKVLRNGQLFILRDGKTYTVTGAEVR